MPCFNGRRRPAPCETYHHNDRRRPTDHGPTTPDDHRPYQSFAKDRRSPLRRSMRRSYRESLFPRTGSSWPSQASDPARRQAARRRSSTACSAEARRSARSSSNASRKPAAIRVSLSDDLVAERRLHTPRTRAERRVTVLDDQVTWGTTVLGPGRSGAGIRAGRGLSGLGIRSGLGWGGRRLVGSWGGG